MNENAEHVLANIEQLGVQIVRDMIWSGRWPANYDALAKEWLRQKDVEQLERNEAYSETQTQEDTKEPERKDADSESQMLLALASNELAHSARGAALDANKRAEDASKRAETANMRADDANKRAEDANKRSQGANVIARNAKNIAWAAATSVEQSAGTAKTTKRIAIAALVAALIAIAIPIATLFIRWPPALEALISIMWQR